MQVEIWNMLMEKAQNTTMMSRKACATTSILYLSLDRIDISMVIAEYMVTFPFKQQGLKGLFKTAKFFKVFPHVR